MGAKCCRGDDGGDDAVETAAAAGEYAHTHTHTRHPRLRELQVVPAPPPMDANGSTPTGAGAEQMEVLEVEEIRWAAAASWRDTAMVVAIAEAREGRPPLLSVSPEAPPAKAPAAIAPAEGGGGEVSEPKDSDDVHEGGPAPASLGGDHRDRGDDNVIDIDNDDTHGEAAAGRVRLVADDDDGGGGDGSDGGVVPPPILRTPLSPRTPPPSPTPGAWSVLSNGEGEGEGVAAAAAQAAAPAPLGAAAFEACDGALTCVRRAPSPATPPVVEMREQAVPLAGGARPWEAASEEEGEELPPSPAADARLVPAVETPTTEGAGDDVGGGGDREAGADADAGDAGINWAVSRVGGVPQRHVDPQCMTAESYGDEGEDAAVNAEADAGASADADAEVVVSAPADDRADDEGRPPPRRAHYRRSYDGPSLLKAADAALPVGQRSLSAPLEPHRPSAP